MGIGPDPDPRYGPVAGTRISAPVQIGERTPPGPFGPDAIIVHTDASASNSNWSMPACPRIRRRPEGVSVIVVCDQGHHATSLSPAHTIAGCSRRRSFSASMLGIGRHESATGP